MKPIRRMVPRRSVECCECLSTVYADYFPRMGREFNCSVRCANCQYTSGDIDYPQYLSLVKEQSKNFNAKNWPQEVLSNTEEQEEQETSQYWSGCCLDCECEWNGMEDQNCCPKCGSIHCDLYEEDSDAECIGEGIINA